MHNAVHPAGAGSAGCGLEPGHEHRQDGGAVRACGSRCLQEHAHKRRSMAAHVGGE
jgi:hypothetical protein